AALLQILEPGRERLVAHAAGALAELAEPERSALKHAQDLRGPRFSQDLDRRLERPAGGVERRLRHSLRVTPPSRKETPAHPLTDIQRKPKCYLGESNWMRGRRLHPRRLS